MNCFNTSVVVFPSSLLNAPLLIKLTILSFVTIRLVTFLQKSSRDLNGRFNIISWITGAVILVMPFKPYKILLFLTSGVKPSLLSLMSGSSISI